MVLRSSHTGIRGSQLRENKTNLSNPAEIAFLGDSGPPGSSANPRNLLRSHPKQLNEPRMLFSVQRLGEPICRHVDAVDVADVDLLPLDLLNHPLVPDVNGAGASLDLGIHRRDIGVHTVGETTGRRKLLCVAVLQDLGHPLGRQGCGRQVRELCFRGAQRDESLLLAFPHHWSSSHEDDVASCRMSAWQAVCQGCVCESHHQHVQCRQRQMTKLNAVRAGAVEIAEQVLHQVQMRLGRPCVCFPKPRCGVCNVGPGAARNPVNRPGVFDILFLMLHQRSPSRGKL
ncbi:hypothetical protein N658DRAFT_293893, partial [Parathielavia hyrcaniae]